MAGAYHAYVARIGRELWWMVLAERDPGGGLSDNLAKFVQQLNAGLKPGLGGKLIGKIGDAVIRAGTSGQVNLETMAAAIGKELVKMKAEKWAKDDLFPPKLLKVTIPKPDFSWPNGSSLAQKVIFDGLQGKYVVTYSWRLM